MADIDSLYKKQEEVYRDCCEINNCKECFHNNGNNHIDCDLALITRQISEQTK